MPSLGVERHPGWQGDQLLRAGSLGVGAAFGGVVDVGCTVAAWPDTTQLAVQLSANRSARCMGRRYSVWQGMPSALRAFTNSSREGPPKAWAL